MAWCKCGSNMCHTRINIEADKSSVRYYEKCLKLGKYPEDVHPFGESTRHAIEESLRTHKDRIVRREQQHAIYEDAAKAKRRALKTQAKKDADHCKL